MIRLILILAILALPLSQSRAMPADRAVERAVADARAAIDAAERAALSSQSLDELNAAAREQVIRELKLSGSKRRAFETLYTAYRKALDNAITPVAEPASPSDTEQRRALQVKLANIASTAQVKREYVEKFAAILSAEQIRQLYNAEGAISTSIKRSAAERMPRLSNLRGSGRLVTQDWGQAGNYTHIVAGLYCEVILNPAAHSVTVTADDNVIDYVAMTNEGGRLEFRFNASVNNLQNISISITVPMSNALRVVTAGTYGKVTAVAPLKVPSMKVDISSYGAVNAQIESSGGISVSTSSYGKFKGSVYCASGDFRISSYGRFEGPVECRDSCRVALSSYARFTDSIKAQWLSLSVGSYAGFTGSVAAANSRISVGSYGSFDGTFSGTLLDASVGSYGKMKLNGAARVAEATVEISSGASFSAPDLQVSDYRLRASGYSKADVWCAGNLRIEASSQSKVTYSGPCQVEALSENIRRK